MILPSPSTLGTLRLAAGRATTARLTDARLTGARRSRPSPAPVRRGPEVALLLLLAAALLPVAVAPGAAAQASAATLRGEVVDAQGEPLADARAELLPLADPYREGRTELAGDGSPEPAARGRTGADGELEIDLPGHGFHRLEISARGRVPRHLTVGPVAADRTLPPVALPPDVGLEVRVLDAGGAPVAGARLAAVPTAEPPSWWMPESADRSTPRNAVSDEAGRATLPRAEDEAVALLATAPGFAPALARVAEGDAGPVELHLEPGVPRTVVVVDARGEPVAEALVRGHPRLRVDGEDADAHYAEGIPLGLTGADGRVTLRLPAEGGLALVVRSATGAATRATVDAPEPAEGDDEPDAVRLTLAAPRTLAGRVLTAGERTAVPGAWVWVSGAPHVHARAGGDGGYSLPLPPLAGRRPAVRAAAPGHLPALERLGDRAADGSNPFTLLLHPAAAAAGRVVTTQGEPVAGAELVAELSPRGRRSPAAVREVRTASGDDGRFRLRPLDAGSLYSLRVTAPGFAPERRDLTGPEAGSERTGLEIVLQPGLTAFGRVVDLDEEPVVGADVTLDPQTAGSASFFGRSRSGDERYAVTGDDGTFEIQDLAPGRADLRVHAAGRAPLAVPGVELPAGGSPVDLGTVVLEPGAVLEGRVTDADDDPLEDAAVKAYPARAGFGFGPRRGAEPTEATTGPDGRFRIPDLASGERVTLVVERSGFADRRLEGVEVPGDEPLTVVLERSARLAGVVVERGGEPVPDAWVTARVERTDRMQPSLARAASDEDGRFVLEDLNPGVVNLEARSGDHRPAELRLEVEAGEERDDLRLELAPGAAVEGRVLDAAGSPLPDARVTQVVSQPGTRGASDTTDADGRYRLGGLAPGSHSFAAEHPDHVRSVRDLEVTGTSHRLDFRLEAGLSVSGRVVGTAGEPVDGALVWLRPAGGRGFFSRRLSATTGEDGAFTVRGVEPGRYRLSARDDGAATAELEEPVEVVGSPVQGLVLRFEPGAAVVGRVLGAELDDLSRLVVMAAPLDGGGTPARGNVDYEGRFRVEGVTPGTWMVMTLLGQGEPMATEQVEVEPGQSEVHVDLDVTGGYTLSGQVLFGGEPYSGARVQVLGEAEMQGGFARTDHEGRFRIAGLESGSYRLVVGLGALPHERRVEIDGDREITVDVPAAGVAGTVTAAGGGPVAGADVLLVPAEQDSVRMPLRPNRERTGELGRFRFPAVPAGSYRVRAEKDGHAPAERPVEVTGGAPVEGLDLVLEPAEGLELRVSTTTGGVPDRLSVAAVDPTAAALPGQAPRPVFADGVRTGEAGRVRLDRLPAGTWRLLVSASGLAVASLDVTAPGPAVPVTLRPAGLLEVVVPELTGTPLGGEVRLRGADGRWLVGLDWNGDPRTSWRLALGRARIDSVPAGTWTVEVTAPDGRTWTATARAVPGGETEVVLE